MDCDLRALSPLKPTRSVWPEIEKCIARQEKRQRRHSAVRFAAPALAASAMIALIVYNNHVRRVDEVILIQQTVEKAVRDARPSATFSGLHVEANRQTLEALFVSSKPRNAEFIIGRADLFLPEKGEAEKDFKQGDVNEF